MARLLLLLLAAAASTSCALLPAGDPRGEWGYFENARSVGSPDHPIKSKPWGTL